MKLIATTSTADGRLTSGTIYYGQIVILKNNVSGGEKRRFLCFDDKSEWMTFSLDVFVPYVEPGDRKA